MGSHRVRHDCSDLAAAATDIKLPGEKNGNLLQYSYLGNHKFFECLFSTYLVGLLSCSQNANLVQESISVNMY